jgi:hypothetical protein
MLTHRRHRYLTRWPRRLAFALALALLLLTAWRTWQVRHPAPAPPTTLTYLQLPQLLCRLLGRVLIRPYGRRLAADVHCILKPLPRQLGTARLWA